MHKFLLDANLSPRIARFLTRRHGIDVVSLITLGKGAIGDREVATFARREKRVIITLDRDFLEPYLATGQIAQGIIYLDLPSHQRYIPSIEAILETFFQHHAAELELDRVLIVLTADQVIVHR